MYDWVALLWAAFGEFPARNLLATVNYRRVYSNFRLQEPVLDKSVYRYVLLLGFLDGWNGFLFHFLQGFWFRLMVDVKMGEYSRRMNAGEITEDELVELSGGKRRVLTGV